MQIFYPLFFLMPVLFTACVSTSNCRELTGRWTTYEGQDLVFEPNGNALWLTKFGSQYDTVRMRFQYDCAAKPITLDLSDFQNGPHTGKSLFGIFDWSSDSSFRFRYEVGSQPTVRPQDFDMEQTQKFSWAPN